MKEAKRKWLAVLRSDSTDDLCGPELGARQDVPRIALHVFPEDSPRHEREIDSSPVPMVTASFEWTLVPGPDTLQ